MQPSSCVLEGKTGGSPRNFLRSCLLRPCKHKPCALRNGRLFVLVSCLPEQISMSNPEPIIALMKLPVLLEYNTRSLARLYPSISHRQPIPRSRATSKRLGQKFPMHLNAKLMPFNDTHTCHICRHLNLFSWMMHALMVELGKK